MESLGRRAARLTDLRHRLRHRPEGQVVVDGRRLALDLVRWGVPIRELYVAAGQPHDEALVAAAAQAWEVDAGVLAELAPTRHPQGVLAVVDEPRRPRWQAATGVGVYLDGVQDPGNLGAIVRATAALGGEAVLLSVGCADPFHPAAVRGSSGAVFRVPVERQVAIEDMAARVRGAAGEVWLGGGGGRPVAGWEPPRPLLLLLGAEGRGVSEGVAAHADGVVTIPLDREVESLNVAVAAGILLQQLRSRAGRRPSDVSDP